MELVVVLIYYVYGRELPQHLVVSTGCLKQLSYLPDMWSNLWFSWMTSILECPLVLVPDISGYMQTPS